ncbi:MaoC family dehydratase N-terminal domain-containing protein [Nocardioides sp. W7]|uniref:bifunctional MaoC family dehydratase N-terminal/OB-fold nucleic acid binding domain-containing protein n=1 Tax=Nocardioides sp. W7 TaxID=2931390 RepID=UPI001FD493B5|nr:MaoC family dehydratase N-terminal domain-containing protein [Nocardioides sp. W7]
MTAAYEDLLQGWVGRALGEPRAAQDPVNVPMIRQWVEALGLRSPVHLDRAMARATGRTDVVAPASMIQAFVMRGYAGTMRRAQETGPFEQLTALLDEGGYTSVVATDSDFEFVRELVPGDEVACEEVVESISPEKSTGLGEGRFVTTRKTYRDGAGTVVATQLWRTFRFRPREVEPPRALRPRPAVNLDNQFWFDAAREHRLLIQCCADCQVLRHPPGPGCAACGSFSSDVVVATGRATLYSWTVAQHPRHPAFDYPLVIGLVELEEGTRLVANLDPAGRDLEIGMDLRMTWLDVDPELSLPVFGPATPMTEGED